MKKLKKNMFEPFPISEIKPEGWLKKQLKIQLRGLSGNLDKIWPDVRDSHWFGGQAEGWERAPYWLDGVIPLAWLTDDKDLQKRIEKYVDYVISNQQEDGWIGPRKMISALSKTPENYDIWALFLATKFLMQYYDVKKDERAVTAIEWIFRCIDKHIDRAPLFNWGQSRWFEPLIALFWLYEKKTEQWLLDLAVKLKAQGFDWGGFYKDWPMTEATPKGRWNYMSHVVNNAMAVKAHGLWWKLSGDELDKNAVHDMIEKLDRHHGMVTGAMSGDECLAGLSPVQGTELCAIVEYMYSLEILTSIFGESSFGDRLEKLAFNALPAAITPDMWAHQYDQQVNQIECSVRDNRTWKTNRPDANIFGLEPDFGCCTANFSQGWPKFTAHIFMKTHENGIAVTTYAPAKLETLINGIPVNVKIETEYPFRDTLNFHVYAEKPVEFPLLLRIPAWSKETILEINGKKTVLKKKTGYHRIENKWCGTSEIKLKFEMEPEIKRGYKNFGAIVRGPLVYSLKMGEKWKRINENDPLKQLPHGDWEIYPETPWNYALCVSEKTLKKDIVIVEKSLKEMIFSPDCAPVEINLKGKRIPEWHNDNGSASEIEYGKFTMDKQPEDITLVPYGCTNLRITEFPIES